MTELGRTGYEAFIRQLGEHATFWPELPAELRAGWDAAAAAVAARAAEDASVAAEAAPDDGFLTVIPLEGTEGD